MENKRKPVAGVVGDGARIWMYRDCAIQSHSRTCRPAVTPPIFATPETSLPVSQTRSGGYSSQMNTKSSSEIAKPSVRTGSVCLLFVEITTCLPTQFVICPRSPISLQTRTCFAFDAVEFRTSSTFSAQGCVWHVGHSENFIFQFTASVTIVKLKLQTRSSTSMFSPSNDGNFNRTERPICFSGVWKNCVQTNEKLDIAPKLCKYNSLREHNSKFPFKAH